jgi:IS30 family transposase
MKLSSDNFDLSPGAEHPEFGTITGCRVRLIKNSQLTLLSAAIRQKSNAAIRNEQDSSEGELDPYVKFSLTNEISQQLANVYSIEAFVTKDGKEITEFHQIESIYKHLTEPDVEELEWQVKDLADKFRRPKSRAKHKCGKCGGAVECTRTEPADGKAAARNVSAN